MDIEWFLWVVTNLVAAFMRGFQTLGALPIANPEIGTVVRMLPVLVLPFAAWRQLRRRRIPYALSLGLIELYFIFNRLTVFALKPLSLAELIGNLGEVWLGVLMLRPRKETPDRV